MCLAHHATCHWTRSKTQTSSSHTSLEEAEPGLGKPQVSVWKEEVSRAVLHLTDNYKGEGWGRSGGRGGGMEGGRERKGVGEEK